ncbi:MAG: hypothetical protein COZ69_14310 [Deltaproteobacteria bacterium CG_4_8_14_3_um_filter_45_9]|nr:MAG: hypothetical protein COZ69_14310 [Deltaproteobacteria bacterium CG_4_8_14_3_um_filter_45_9]
MFSYGWHVLIRAVKGYRSKSFPPDRLSPSSKSRFFHIMTQPLGGEGKIEGGRVFQYSNISKELKK